MLKIKRIICLLLVATGSIIVVGCGDKPKENQVTVKLSEAAKKYDGKIVKQPSSNRGKEDGWYLVKNGKRSWIEDGAWLAKNGYKATDVIEISSSDFNSIPEDSMPTK